MSKLCNGGTIFEEKENNIEDEFDNNIFNNVLVNNISRLFIMARQSAF